MPGRCCRGSRGRWPRRRRTPESIQYRPAPLRVAVDAAALALPGGVAPTQPSRAELSVFDFGAISLAMPVPGPDGARRAAPPGRRPGRARPADRGGAAGRRPLDRAAPPGGHRLRGQCDLSEEYIVFQIGDARADWLEEHADWIAGLVRLEAGPLSRAEVVEATRLSLSYTPNDLVTLDWAAGFVADRDCADTLQVIEFANVQLLEFRHIDDRLDDRLEAAYRLIRPEPRRSRPSAFWRSHSDALRNVRELEIEATSLFERADNALKLIGDQYLSRVFDLASTRFHLREWQQSIRRKLDTVGDVYDLLVQQAGGNRMEMLEIIVVVLITLEIILAFFRH